MKQLLITSCAFAFICMGDANAMKNDFWNRVIQKQQQAARAQQQPVQPVAPQPAQPAPGGSEASTVELNRIDNLSDLIALPDQDNDITLSRQARQDVVDLQQENVALRQKLASLQRVGSLYDLINLPDRDNDVILSRLARKVVVNLLRQVESLQQKVDITADEKNTTADIATLHTDKV